MIDRDAFVAENTGQFPHCDSYILHAPGECEFCDSNPEWQALRIAWGIAFTGHSARLRPPKEFGRSDPVLPCPADLTRPPNSSSDHRRWGGNTATTKRGDPSQPRQTLASVMMYGDQGGREKWPLIERIWLKVVREPLDGLNMHLRGWHKEDGLWIYDGSRNYRQQIRYVLQSVSKKRHGDDSNL